DLDLYDPTSLETEAQIELARRGEAAALAADPRITNSEGAEFDSSSGRVLLGNSHGFLGEYRSSTFSISVSPIATAPDSGSMQQDSWYAVRHRFARLDSPESVGQEAARRAVRRLGARKLSTRRAPVVFDQEMAAGLLGNLFHAASGYALYKGASFLIGHLGKRLAPELVTIYDDGRLPGGLGSRPFDGEGLPTRKTTVVERGMLTSYLLDTYSGRKLGLASTGNASRGIGESPSVGPTNFYLVPGTTAPAEILRSVREGLYVTELIGFGVNMVTGDYSRGAAGFWIENGELAYPVEEITIAGNLKQMFADIEVVGSDLEFRGRIASPTIKIREMSRAPSTLSRELSRQHASPVTYRAVLAHQRAQRWAHHPRKPRKLAVHPRLRRAVLTLLAQRWSPEQIARGLPQRYPDEPTMRISHEAIYTYLYVLPRGVFKRELVRYLRRRHRFRRPRKVRLSSRPIQDLISIDERPAEVADRTVPGHWEGDLLVGHANASALGTLV